MDHEVLAKRDDSEVLLEPAVHQTQRTQPYLGVANGNKQTNGRSNDFEMLISSMRSRFSALSVPMLSLVATADRKKALSGHPF